jgi:hypothetical protein
MNEILKAGNEAGRELLVLLAGKRKYLFQQGFEFF